MNNIIDESELDSDKDFAEVLEMGITPLIFYEEHNPLTEEHAIGLIAILYNGVTHENPAVKEWARKEIAYLLILYPELAADSVIGVA